MTITECTSPTGWDFWLTLNGFIIFNFLLVVDLVLVTIP